MGFGELKDDAILKIKDTLGQKIVQRVILLVAAALFLVPLATVTVVKIIQKPPEREANVIFKPDKIEDDDIFFPSEPDFVPSVIH